MLSSQKLIFSMTASRLLICCLLQTKRRYETNFSFPVDLPIKDLSFESSSIIWNLSDLISERAIIFLTRHVLSTKTLCIFSWVSLLLALKPHHNKQQDGDTRPFWLSCDRRLIKHAWKFNIVYIFNNNQLLRLAWGLLLCEISSQIIAFTTLSLAKKSHLWA